MTDTLMCVLNDPDVMGKDVFGYVRLKKVLEAWGKCYDLYFDALTEKAQADFKGIMKGGTAVNFEAKHTDADRMDQDRVAPDQAARLRRAYEYGGHAFVVCSFSGRDFFRIPWNVWANMKGHFGHKYITPQEAEPWRIRMGGPGVLLFLEGMERKNDHE